MLHKEIQDLHNKGFVILRASRSTNAPIGWKRPAGAKKKWGYVEEMEDTTLRVYKSTFNAKVLATSHCGFYLGHGDLCCIDLDTKKTTHEQTDGLKNKIVAALGDKVVVETTKSNGYHIYFLYKERLPNKPDWTSSGKANWIEVYYSKRFIACYLSNSKRYTLIHGTVASLKPLNTKEHIKLLECLKPFKGKEAKPVKVKAVEVDGETLRQAESFVKQLEEKELDITGDNPTWFKIGKAFASAFGLKGFDMFNRLSQFSPTYNADTIEDTYKRFVEDEAKPRAKKISIASFFKICLDAGLTDLETNSALQLHPPVAKEFDLVLGKKESMAEHCHTVVTEFLTHANIICIDGKVFYVFENTHWIIRNDRYIVELINNFVDRSNVDDKYRKRLRTVPYLKMMLEEIRLLTQQNSIEPQTGGLKEGIFINLENGVLHIDMKTGKRKLLDHEAKYQFTTLLPYCYDVTATCPRFDSWMDKQVPDKHMHEVYYAFVASCLTKHKADIIMLLAGETSTGKSSLIEITRRIIGIENSTPISAGTLFSGTNEAAAQAILMENKLLAYDFDSQPFKHLEMLLKVAAQEPIMGWQMNIARRPVTNYGRVIIAMNPYNYSVFNPAVARRFVTINMNVPVVKDNSVMPAIYENELAGIFNHVVNIGIKHLLENNGTIKQTEEMRKTTFDFHMKEREAVRWFNDKYVVLHRPDSRNNRLTLEQKYRYTNTDVQVVLTSVSAMYQEFRTWLEDVEGWPINRIPLRKHFAADLKLMGLEEIVYKENGTSKRGVYVGKK
jgi:hypothetical protein